MPAGSENLAILSNIRQIDGEYEVATTPTPHGGIFGAYQLFQLVLVAELAAPGKRVISVQTVFANGGESGKPARIKVETLQNGRSFAFLTLTYFQGDVVISRNEIMLTVDEDDFLHHRNPGAPPVDLPSWELTQPGMWPGQARHWQGSGAEVASLHYRLDEQPSATMTRALLALVTEPAVMASMREFNVMPEASAGRMAGNVLVQTITLLEPADLVAGIVLRSTTRYVGQGRIHGEGNIVDVTGQLLATYSTTGVLRFPR
jgi:acyl-CoA thioesterase-2